MEPTLALHIIAKDEDKQIEKIINTYGQYFDEIAIAYDGDKEPGFATWDKVNFNRYTWCDDFADKRNFLAEKTNSTHYFRMDTDDDILFPEKIRGVFKKMVEKDIGVILCQYLYSFDIDGNCNAKHWRETIIKKDTNHYWKKSVHENIFADNEASYRAVNDGNILIQHNIDSEHIEKSGRRNFKILLKEFEETKDNPDPRTVAYIGRMLLSFGEYEKAIGFLKLLIDTSGWEDDKYYAWIDMAHCYHNLNKLDIAIACCNEALAIKTEFPDAYNVLGELYLEKEDFDKSIDWLKIGLSKPDPETQYVIDPSNYHIKAPMVMAMALFNIGEFENAYKLFSKIHVKSPNNEILNSQADMFREAYENDQYIKHLMWIYQYTQEKDKNKLVNLAESIPDNMMLDERIHSLKHRLLPAKKWSDKSIVIYCGSSWEDWSDPSIITGLGGSEEAVVYVSRELTKLGYEVTVFNNSF